MNPQLATSNPSNLDATGVSCESLHDHQLVEFVRQGRSEAFGVLHRRHQKRLLRTAIRITKNTEDSEDAVQDAFLKAFKRIDTFGGRSSFSTWLTRILINTCLMQLRQKRGRSNVSLDEVWDNGDAWKDSIADTLVDIEGDYRQKQRLALLSQAISVLNPALRVVVETYRHHDCSIAELAERNRISVAAAKSRMLRARVALRGSSRLSKAR